MNIKKLLKKIKEEEKGSFTAFAILLLFGLIIIAIIFLNIANTWLTVNFAKRSLDEATRTRALAIDVPLKEYTGVIEVMHYPHKTNEVFPVIGQVRPVFSSSLTNLEILDVNSERYKNTVKYVEEVAKDNMISALNSYIGNNFSDRKIIEISRENICFDVRPLKSTVQNNVQFRCALYSPEDNYGGVKTLKTVTSNPTTLPGFAEPQNEGKLFKINPINTNQAIYASNAVFGAAIIKPRSLFTAGMEKIGFVDQPEIVIYSIAYPQITDCFGPDC